MAVRPLEEHPHGLHRKWNPKLFFKEIELFIYYVKRPLRGLLKEIPKIHLFSPWIENTYLCIAYVIAFTVQTIKLKRTVNTMFLTLVHFFWVISFSQFFFMFFSLTFFLASPPAPKPYFCCHIMGGMHS